MRNRQKNVSLERNDVLRFIATKFEYKALFMIYTKNNVGTKSTDRKKINMGKSNIPNN